MAMPGTKIALNSDWPSATLVSARSKVNLNSRAQAICLTQAATRTPTDIPTGWLLVFVGSGGHCQTAMSKWRSRSSRRFHRALRCRINRCTARLNTRSSEIHDSQSSGPAMRSRETASVGHFCNFEHDFHRRRLRGDEAIAQVDGVVSRGQHVRSLARFTMVSALHPTLADRDTTRPRRARSRRCSRSGGGCGARWCAQEPEDLLRGLAAGSSSPRVHAPDSTLSEQRARRQTVSTPASRGKDLRPRSSAPDRSRSPGAIAAPRRLAGTASQTCRRGRNRLRRFKALRDRSLADHAGSKRRKEKISPSSSQSASHCGPTC